MDITDIGFLTATAFCTSMLTAVVGAGGGTVLIAVLLQFMDPAAAIIQILIGCFIIVTLFTRQIKQLRSRELPLWAFVPLGFITGALNMIVGVIAPVLGVLVIRKDLDKEAVVGTLGFFGLVGNAFKVVGFSLIGFSIVATGRYCSPLCQR